MGGLGVIQLMAPAGNDSSDGNGNVVETYISYLRNKLHRDDLALIHTVRGVGYVLRTDGR